jgi:hypothetical protein
MMAAGVEGRLPFMEEALVAAALASSKASNPPGKKVLKAAAASMLPPYVIKRKKDTFQGGTGIAAAVGDFIDSPTSRVVAFDFEADSGALSNQRTVIELPSGNAGDGGPDGMTIDEEGMLWIALWDGWRVTRWNPLTGKMIDEIRMPVARPTSCVVGGPNLDELYITSASTRMPAADLARQPLAGGLFRCRPGVRGAVTHAFAG